MNRREFLKGILASAAITAINPEAVLDEMVERTSHLSDSEFVYYYTYQFQILITNPSKCAIIDGITE